MLKLYKKQVKGIIDLLKSESCKNRPALQTMRIKRDGYAYITNGYITIRFKTLTGPVPTDDNKEDLIIPLEKLETWYKLAGSKDYIDEFKMCSDELIDVDNDTHYPDVAQIIKLKMDRTSLVEEMVYDNKLLDIFTRIAGSDNVKVKGCGRDAMYLKSVEQQNIDGVLMQLST